MESFDLFSQPPAAEDPETSSDSGTSEASEASVEARRDRILDQIRGGGRKLTSLESRVAYLLSQFPETRNSDITLQLQYWSVFQKGIMDGRMPSPDLYYKAERLTNLARARRVVQNDLKLFLATDDRVAKKRKQLSESYRQAMVPADLAVPNIFVYADESGKNEDHLIVGSVWMLATGDYQSFVEDTARWKEERDINYELHSSSLGRRHLEAYKDFIIRFVIEQGTLGFKAITLPNSGHSDQTEVLSDMFYWLVRLGVEHEHRTGRAPLPRRVLLTKDAEEAGSDERMLTGMKLRMARDAESIFNNQLHFEADDPLSSASDILIQIADLFTLCVHRKLNVPVQPGSNPNWKSQFAEWFLNAVDFDLETANVGDRAVRLSLRSPTIARSMAEVFETPADELDRLPPVPPGGDTPPNAPA